MAIYLLENATATGAGTGIYAKDYSVASFHALGATSSGAGAATITVDVSNDGANWILAHDTFTLTLSATTANAGIEWDAVRWAYVRGNVTAISGTDASVSLLMGV